MGWQVANLRIVSTVVQQTVEVVKLVISERESLRFFNAHHSKRQLHIVKEVFHPI